MFWESVIMNFIIKLLKFKNSAWEVRFNSILIIVNRLTKYMMFISFRETVTASVLMYIILWELINNHELLKKFITDRDKLFMSKFWKMLTAELEIKHKMLMTYHLQMNEQSKWINQTVKMYLWHYVNINKTIEYNCCQWHSLCTTMCEMKPQKRHHLRQTINIIQRFEEICECMNLKVRKQCWTLWSSRNCILIL